jgi:hypothetical protein
MSTRLLNRILQNEKTNNIFFTRELVIVGNQSGHAYGQDDDTVGKALQIV